MYVNASFLPLNKNDYVIILNEEGNCAYFAKDESKHFLQAKKTSTKNISKASPARLVNNISIDFHMHINLEGCMSIVRHLGKDGRV